MIKWVESGDGVKLKMCYDRICNAYVYSDIEVEPGITSIEMNVVSSVSGICLKDNKKIFPDVEVLILHADLKYVKISNGMFPNLKEIRCDSQMYKSVGTLLYQKVNKNSCQYRLINAFNIHKDLAIDLDGVTCIEKGALEGCESDNFINAQSLTSCQRESFDESLFEKCTIENPLLMLGGVLIAISNEVETLEIPSELVINYVLEGFKNSSVKHLIVHNSDVLPIILRYMSPKKITIMDTAALSYTLFMDSGFIAQTLQSVEITEENPYFSTQDGIIYSKNKSKLIFCPRGKSGEIIIPEGVQSIYTLAFANSNIQSVKFPESLKRMERFAFYGCVNLECVELSHNLHIIENSTFTECEALKSIDIPGCVTCIQAKAFMHSGLQFVKLHEGLEVIGKEAFDGCSIQKMYLPESLICVEEYNFCNVEHIFVKKEIPEGLIKALRYIYTEEDKSLIATVHVGNDIQFLVPKDISRTRTEAFEHHMRAYPDDTEYADSLYLQLNSETAQDLAIRVYQLRPNDTLASYLKANRNKIVTRLLKHETEQELIEYLALGLATKGTLNMALKKAQKSGLTIATAYILSALAELPKPNKNFNL